MQSQKLYNTPEILTDKNVIKAGACTETQRPSRLELASVVR